MSLNVLWPFFHHREKQNSSHFKAYCKGCMTHHEAQAELLDESAVSNNEVWRRMNNLMTGRWKLIQITSLLVELHVTHPVCVILVRQLGATGNPEITEINII
jgi:hypothetical protein